MDKEQVEQAPAQDDAAVTAQGVETSAVLQASNAAQEAQISAAEDILDNMTDVTQMQLPSTIFQV